MRITRSSISALVGLALAGGILAPSASADVAPVADRQLVSTAGFSFDIAGDVNRAAVATNTRRGGHIVVWNGTRGPGTDDRGIVARIFDAEGEPLGPQFSISDAFDDSEESTPAVAYNSTEDEYFVVWDDEALGNGLIVTKTVSPSGTPSPVANTISSASLFGDRTSAGNPAVVYNPNDNEYLVAWEGVQRPAPPADDVGVEIYVRRMGPAGGIRGEIVRISDMGPDGETAFRGIRPSVAHNPADNEYLVTWDGLDDGPLQGRDEVFAQRLDNEANEIGFDLHISTNTGNNDVGESASDVVFDDAGNSYVVAFSGDESPGLAEGEKEIHVQRLSRAGAKVGPLRRVSDMGPVNDSDFDAFTPTIAYDSTTSGFLVAWNGDDNTESRTNDEYHIWAQQLDGELNEVGPAEAISQNQRFSGATYSAFRADAAYDPIAKEHIVAWDGHDDMSVPGETLRAEILRVFSRRLALNTTTPTPTPGPTEPGREGTNDPPGDAQCATPPTISGGGSSGTLSLTSTQLKINQRIGQAAVRRANAIQGWLDDGLVNSDLCGGSLTPDQLHSGVAYTQGLLQAAPAKADPRGLSIPPATPKPGVTFEVTAEQLQINQKVYSAAVRRANALKARIEGELTGGDIKDAELTRDRLRQDLARSALLTAAANTPSASTTNVEPAKAKTVTFTPTLKQLGINQKIAQAAVKRTNELRTLLGTGLTGENFADGSITAADWAP